MAAADHQDDLNKLIQCRGDMEMTSRRISHLAAALAGVLTMSGIATQVLAQEIRGDQLDERSLHSRAVEAVIWGMPAVNAQLMFDSVKQAGSDFNQIVYWSRPLTWKNQTLTPNPNTIYVFPFYNTKDVGPMVLEIPSANKEDSITGSVDDAWQTALQDVGPAGVDKGKGGKYLILPPGYKEKVPDGYIALPSNTYTGFAILRSNLESESEMTDFANPNAYPVDGRGVTYSYAYFSPKHLGEGQFYLMNIADKDGMPLDGGKTYRLHVPANAPVKLYWSATVYDRATHAFVREMPKLACSSLTPGLVKNADGSVDAYFGPKAPAGKEANWVPTKSGGGFEVLFRFYGPEKPLFDKTWKLGDIAEVK
jgi:hypothetical protein